MFSTAILSILKKGRQGKGRQGKGREGKEHRVEKIPNSKRGWNRHSVWINAYDIG